MSAFPGVVENSLRLADHTCDLIFYRRFLDCCEAVVSTFGWNLPSARAAAAVAAAVAAAAAVVVEVAVAVAVAASQKYHVRRLFSLTA